MASGSDASSENLRKRARAVLVRVADRFPPVEIGLLDELIDANEPGVAIEILSQLLAESGTAHERQVIDEIADLVPTLGLDTEVVSRLARLERRHS